MVLGGGTALIALGKHETKHGMQKGKYKLEKRPSNLQNKF